MAVYDWTIVVDHDKVLEQDFKVVLIESQAIIYCKTKKSHFKCLFDGFECINLNTFLTGIDQPFEVQQILVD